MRSTLSWLFVGAAIAAPAAAIPSSLQAHSFHEDHVLGTSFDMTVVADNAADAVVAHWAARDEINRLDKVLSTWRPDSEISALNAASGPARVSPDLATVLASAEIWRARTDGAFSARLGTVEAAWNQAQAAGSPPEAAKLAALAEAAASAPVRTEGGQIERTADVRFAPDGLAKGYIIDAAMRAARTAAPGVSGMMIDIGGDMRCQGASPSGQGWSVGVAAPRAADNAGAAEVLLLNNKAVATSGLGQRDRVIAGCAYSQTLSPADGAAVATPLVTVVADRALDADALASALSVMPVDRGLALVERTRGAEARIVHTSGLVAATSGWSGLLRPAVNVGPTAANLAVLDCAAPAAKAWPSGFQLNINYTLPQMNDPRHPPFVAVWITDAKGTMVRTLFHLGNRPPRYLNSNYVWWAQFQKATPDALDSVTRPTRLPGVYDASWDGKDDTGKPVAQGDYIVHIEASREHGGHAIQDIPITLGAKAITAANAGGGELGATRISYGKGQ